MSLFLNEHGVPTVADFGHLFCGEKLGGGIGRQVFVLAIDPTRVVKIETASASFQNIIEWETWKELKETPHAKWLAPCWHISPCGIVLIMDRTTPMRPGDEPKQMPEWLSDFKRSNYGALGGRVVCHDYGLNLLLNHGAFAGKMKRPQWWD